MVKIWIYEAILYITVAYILLCKINCVKITRQIFFQTEHISAVEFVMGYKKTVSFLVIPQSTRI